MTNWSYAMQASNQHLVGWTVGQVIEDSAAKYGESEILLSCHQGISKTYKELNGESSRFAAGLLSLGFKQGDIIGIWSPNCYEWVITFFAAAKAGLILANINPAYHSAEFKYCLNKVGVRGIVCPAQTTSYKYYDILTENVPEILAAKPATPIVSKEIPSLKCVITMDEKELNGAFQFRNIFDAGMSENYATLMELKKKIQFDDGFNIMFTSGSTGFPKAVLQSHFSIVNFARLCGARVGLDKEKDRAVICSPLYHGSGSLMGLLSHTIYGGTTIMPGPLFDARAILKSIKENRVTSCYGVPAHFVDLINEYKKNPFEIVHLHAALIVGAPCPEKLVLTVMECLKMKDLTIAFGMTETLISFQSFPSDSLTNRASTVGVILDHMEGKVVDGEGNIVPVGVPGELYVRGYSVLLRYWDDEKNTKEGFQNGRWFKTGDLVTMDKNKYLKIIGRLSDMIIRGGENIYPAEIENFFLDHDSIIDAKVFGVPDKRWGEEAAMWVRSSDSNLTEEDIKRWAIGKISQFKIPKYILNRKQFPTNFVGKVDKNKMREETIKMLEINCD